MILPMLMLAALQVPAAVPAPCASLGNQTAVAACTARAAVTAGNWAEAATAFETAAKASAFGRDSQGSSFWAAAGNAWLAVDEIAKARAALDHALVAGTLTGQALGDAQLDHARTMVALGDAAAARRDLDLALANVPEDPLAWLLSATLARRSDDLARAKTDIAEATKRSPADPAVQLEAGNIAAKAGDEAGARTAWAEAVRLAPTSAQGRSAAAALEQFAPAPPAR